ncbi:MAG: DUF2784 domain-containing protein [Gammaproteobacteria bacterium]|nr:MAG: DUF2784 domain-containing protein [Gammaproteobacteria bacterium]
MIYHVTANLLVMIHLVFIVFVIAGGFIVLIWPWVILLHIPAVIWGGIVELKGWICVLTPWENNLRRLAGQEGYPGGFIEHYIVSLIYPAELTRDAQIVMGVIVIIINLCVYSFIVYRLMCERKYLLK